MAAGTSRFANLPARRVTIQASNASGLKGVVGEVVNAGEVRNVRIVLEPTGSLRGRALRQNLSPAAGVIADLLINNRHVFTQTGSDGIFEFPTTRSAATRSRSRMPSPTGLRRAAAPSSGPSSSATSVWTRRPRRWPARHRQRRDGRAAQRHRAGRVHRDGERRTIDGLNVSLAERRRGHPGHAQSRHQRYGGHDHTACAAQRVHALLDSRAGCEGCRGQADAGYLRRRRSRRWT